MTMSDKTGDTIQVRVSRGLAWLTGNASSPLIDNTEAFKARDNTFEAAKLAEASEEEAISAKLSADRAENTVPRKQGKDDEAFASTSIAKTKEEEVTASATLAQEKAENAADSASEVNKKI